MNRILALLAAMTMTACQNTRPPPIASGPVLIQGFDANNQPTMTSYAGRTSAASGAINDTSEAEIIKALAEKIEPGTPFAYSHIVKSDIVQPNVDIEAKLEQESKDALLDVGKALAAGASGDYAKAMDRVASSGEKLIAVRAAKANAPKPDSGANSARLLAVGVDSGLTTVAAVSSYKDGHNAKTRASYGSTSDTKTTDTTSAADYLALAESMKEARLAAEAARLAAQPIPLPPAAPVDPPIVFPPLDPAPVPPVTPPASTNATETIVLPGLPR